MWHCSAAAATNGEVLCLETFELHLTCHPARCSVRDGVEVFAVDLLLLFSGGYQRSPGTSHGTRLGESALEVDVTTGHPAQPLNFSLQRLVMGLEVVLLGKRCEKVSLVIAGETDRAFG